MDPGLREAIHACSPIHQCRSDLHAAYPPIATGRTSAMRLRRQRRHEADEDVVECVGSDCHSEAPEDKQRSERGPGQAAEQKPVPERGLLPDGFQRVDIGHRRQSAGIAGR